MSCNLIFYDTETTGIHKDFSQIIQCGSIFTDDTLKVIDEQNIGSKPLPWIIPQPKAMLTNKKINSFSSNISHYQMMKDIQHQWKEWCIDSPSIFVTYNGHAFDEELIRRQFWCNLLEPYVTNTNQNGRLDLMLMIHNVAAFFSDEISIPLFEDGPAFSIKLEHLANEHGIDVSDAHDAISDCKFMIGLCKVIKDKIPEVFDSFLNISSKEGIKNLLNVNLSKKLQSSDWSQRPLNSKQLIYAENHVKYLPKIYLFLIQKIKKKRLVRMIKTMNLINTEIGDTFEPKLAYKRIKTKSVNRDQKMLIKKYAHWRELQAQKYDIPRNWVVSDKNLIRASKERFDDLLKNRKNKDQMLEQFKSYLKLKNFSQKGL